MPKRTKPDAEWHNAGNHRYLVVHEIPLEYFADLETSAALFERAVKAADEKDGGPRADH